VYNANGQILEKCGLNDKDEYVSQRGGVSMEEENGNKMSEAQKAL
jgi:hypothetical protein